MWPEERNLGGQTLCPRSPPSPPSSQSLLVFPVAEVIQRPGDKRSVCAQCWSACRATERGGEWWKVEPEKLPEVIRLAFQPQSHSVNLVAQWALWLGSWCSLLEVVPVPAQPLSSASRQYNVLPPAPKAKRCAGYSVPVLTCLPPQSGFLPWPWHLPALLRCSSFGSVGHAAGFRCWLPTWFLRLC